MKINTLPAIDIEIVHMKFQIESPKQTEALFRKPYCLQTDSWTRMYRGMDGRKKWIQYIPTTSFIGIAIMP